MKFNRVTNMSFLAIVGLAVIVATGAVKAHASDVKMVCGHPCVKPLKIVNVLFKCEELLRGRLAFIESGRSIIVNQQKEKLSAHLFGPDYGDGSVPLWGKVALKRAGINKRSFRGAKFAMNYRSEFKRRRPEFSLFTVKSPILGDESSIGFACHSVKQTVTVSVNNLVACPAFCYEPY